MAQARLQDALARIARAAERIEQEIDSLDRDGLTFADDPAAREAVAEAVAELDVLLARLAG